MGIQAGCAKAAHCDEVLASNGGDLFNLETMLQQEQDAVPGGCGQAVWRMRASIDDVKKTIDLLHQLDTTLAMWIKQLNRAQPWRPFRVSVIFSKSSSVLVDGVKRYDPEPIIGRMVQAKNGRWRFYKLRGALTQMRLVDLRVGKGLPGDPVVMRILQEIEELLAHRAALLEGLVSPRRGGPGRRSALYAQLTRSADKAIDLAGRVKLDWSADPLGAEQALQAARREKIAQHKARKANQVLQSGAHGAVSVQG